MLANSCWQIQIGVCVNDVTTCLQAVGEKLSRIETSSIFRQQFADMLLCRSHTHQFEFANTSWPTLVWRVKAALEYFAMLEV